jgi:hypothetical protein
MQRLWQAGDKSVQPTNRHYNVVLNALAKSDDDLRARKAYKMLQQMLASDFVQPDIITYTSVIECLSKSSSSDPQAAETAQELLQQAFDSYEETKDVNVMPNLRTFTMVILTLSSRPSLENVGKARALLTQLLDLYEETNHESLRPNAYPFNYVLNCAANCLGTSKEKIQAFQIASHTYQQVRKSDLIKPDSFTYAFWFKCCNNLLPMGDLRIKCLSYAFDQCKVDGLVNKEVLMRLSHGVAANILATMLDMPPDTSHVDFRRLQVDDLPPHWSRNARRVR